MLLAALTALMLTSGPVGLERREATPGPRLGVQLDVGAPDGIGVSLSYMPAPTLRMQLGGLNNGIGSGVRLGGVLIAFPESAFRPLFGVEGGYVFGGAGEWALALFPEGLLRTTLRGTNVAFVNSQVGFELGSKHVALVVRVGLSWVNVTARDQEVSMNEGGSVTVGGVSLTGFIPSARLGFIVCFG